MVYINDKLVDSQDNQSLSELLNALNIDVKKGIALALNNTVIPKSDWDTQRVHNNDKILLIKAAQGG
jgi:sulfur carrier protein